MKPAFLSLTAVVLLTLANSAHAQFSAPTAVTANTDVNATGTTVEAVSVNAVFSQYYGFGGNTSDTVNGVTFSSNPPSDGYSITGFLNGEDSSGVVQQSGMSSDFANALDVSLTNASSGSATIGGLTGGHTYELQIFAGVTDSSGTETISDGTNSAVLSYGTSVTPSGDEYLTDTFVATSGSVTLNFTAGTGGIVLINAFNLRDEGVASSPEPSTYAMMLGGLALLGFCVRRKLA